MRDQLRRHILKKVQYAPKGVVLMILEPKKTTVAYRCPECGAGVLSVVDIFALSANRVKLKCDCGKSEMDVVI